jgi:hypothetical protein
LTKERNNAIIIFSIDVMKQMEETSMIFNEEVIRLAEQRIRQALASGESLALLQFKVGESRLVVSTQSEAIVGSSELTVDGKTFYIGFGADSVSVPE